MALESLAEEITTVVPIAAIAVTALGLSGVAFAVWLHWIRGRRSSSRTPEVLFVGRWGDHGPELFRVGKDVRRLPERRPRPSRVGVDSTAMGIEVDSTALAFSEQVLAEVMRCRPARRLAHAFADALVEPLPDDGFVLSAFEIEAWLESRAGRRGPSEIVASWGRDEPVPE